MKSLLTHSSHLGLRNFAGLMVVRFLLGIAESVVTPGFVLYTSMFYTRREQVLRTMLWAAMQGLFSIVSSLLSYGLGHITNTALKPWMYIFLVLGLLSIIVGFLWFFLMPETPNKAKFLTHEEQIVAVQRVAQNMMGIKGYQWKYYQMWHAVKDVKTWLVLAFVVFTQLPNGGLTSFGSLVISGFGFDSFKTLLIGLPSSVVSAGSMVVWGSFSIKYGNLRTYGMIVPLLPAIAGIAAVYGTMDTGANKYGRVVAYWLINSYAVTVRLVPNSVALMMMLIHLTVAIRPHYCRAEHCRTHKASNNQYSSIHHVCGCEHRRAVLIPKPGCTEVCARDHYYPGVFLCGSPLRHSLENIHDHGE